MVVITGVVRTIAAVGDRDLRRSPRRGDLPRALLSGEPRDDAFVERLVDPVLSGPSA